MNIKPSRSSRQEMNMNIKPSITVQQDQMKDLKSLTLDELTKELTAAGYPKFRAGQIYRWLHVQTVRSLDEMTNIPKDLRAYLHDNFRLTVLTMADRQISKLDGTQKFLFELMDGETVESVFMKYKFGNSVCVSSQVGCRMGCRFCASTLDGLKRNLLPSEILEQVYEIGRITGEKISHVVVMGTGEPMDNYDNVVRFIRLLTDENGQNLSQRNITVSTCGIVPGIRALADEDLSITLALSLHAPTDEERRRIMPIANRYSIEEMMEACAYYFQKTGRRITFEYSLIRGENDSDEQAVQLAALARKVQAHVNLIPVNPVKERGYQHPDDTAVRRFSEKLEKHGVNVSIRRVLGRDIDGACGQLRHRHLESGPVQG